jgi:hypothetical protein
VDILYSKTTYQFNKYFFLRAVVQYDSYLKRLLTDFLASSIIRWDMADIVPGDTRITPPLKMKKYEKMKVVEAD